jgi:hypothetical protein
MRLKEHSKESTVLVTVRGTSIPSSALVYQSIRTLCLRATLLPLYDVPVATEVVRHKCQDSANSNALLVNSSLHSK